MSEPIAEKPVPRRGIFGWMMFDWAAQPFFTVVITFIFGPYFVSQLAKDPDLGQAWWGYAITASGFMLLMLTYEPAYAPGRKAFPQLASFPLGCALGDIATKPGKF